MGYTLVALEDKILEMYPEITNKGISPRISFDEAKDAWMVRLVKGDKDTTICLNKEDADACLENKYCEKFGREIGTFLSQVK